MDTTLLIRDHQYFILFSLSIEAVLALAFFLYYWSLGLRKKAFNLMFKKMYLSVLALISVYLIANVILQGCTDYQNQKCLTEAEVVLPYIFQLENESILLYNGLIKASTSIVSLDIVFSITAIFASPEIAIFLLDTFPVAENTVMNLLLNGVRGFGFLLLILRAFKIFLVVSGYLTIPLIWIGSLLTPLTSIRRIGISLMILGISIGYIIPFFAVIILKDMKNPVREYVNKISKLDGDKIGYLNFSVKYPTGTKYFPIASLVLERNSTVTHKSITETYVITYISSSKEKTVCLPEGSYSLKGVLIYWAYFPLCTKELCPPGFISSKSTLHISKGNTTKVYIYPWKIFPVPCNNSRVRGCGGLVYGIYKTKRSFSYITFSANQSSLYYRINLLPGRNVEIYSLGERPIVIIENSNSTYINYSIFPIRYFSNANFTEGLRLTRDAIEGFNRWWKRNERLFNSVDNFSDLIDNPSLVFSSYTRLTYAKVKEVKPLACNRDSVPRWYLIAAAYKNGSGLIPANLTVIIPASKRCWNYSYLTYTSEWRYVDSFASSSIIISNIWRVWSLIVRAYTMIIEAITIAVALNIVSKNVSGTVFMGWFVYKLKKSVSLSVFKGKSYVLGSMRLRKSLKKMVPRMRILSKNIIYQRYNKVKEAECYFKRPQLYIRKIGRRKLIDKAKHLAELGLYKYILACKILPDLKYSEGKILFRREKINTLEDSIFTKLRNDIRKTSDVRKLVSLYRVFNRRIINDKNLSSLEVVEHLTGDDLDKFYRTAREIAVQGIKENNLRIILSLNTLLKMETLIESTYKTTGFKEIRESLMRIYISTILYLTNKRNASSLTRIYSNEIKKVKLFMSHKTPVEILSFIKLLENKQLYETAKKTFQDSIVLDQKWLNNLYLDYVYLDKFLSSNERKEIDKIFQGIVIFGLDKYYPDLLYISRRVLKHLRKCQIDVDMVKYYEDLKEKVLQMEESLFYYPSWFQGDKEKVEKVISAFFDAKYLPRSDEIIYLDKTRYQKIDEKLLCDVLGYEALRDQEYSELVRFYFTNMPLIQRINFLEKRLEKRISDLENSCLVDEQGELLAEIRSIIMELENVLRKIIIKSEEENIRNAYFRRKLKRIHQYYKVLERIRDENYE